MGSDRLVKDSCHDERYDFGSEVKAGREEVPSRFDSDVSSVLLDWAEPSLDIDADRGAQVKVAVYPEC